MSAEGVGTGWPSRGYEAAIILVTAREPTVGMCGL